MKVGRRYVLNVPPVTVSVAQDLAQFNGAANHIYRIIKCWIGCTDTSIATGQMLSLRARFLPATVTNGSGGTGSLTPNKVDQADAACSSATNLINSTTKATTSGSAVILLSASTHLYQPFVWDWEAADECPIIIPSTAFVFELLSTVGGTVNLSGGVLVEEI